MGNSCFANTSDCITKHFEICLDDKQSNIKVNSIKIEKENVSKIDKLKNYFKQNEREISEYFNQKNIKFSPKKKRNSVFANLLLIDNTKYEAMLKNLLSQKNKKIKGPKRRETIRNKDQINSLINEVLTENKNKNNNKYKRVNSKRHNSIIIKNKEIKKRRRHSTSFKKEEFIKTKNSKNSLNKIIKSKMIKANTLNEILTDGNRSTVFNKKETYKV